MNLLQRLGLSLPVIQAPMAGVQDWKLAAAVSNAGALGSLPAAMFTPEKLIHEIEQLRAATSAAYNLNFFCHTPPVAQPARVRQWQETLLPMYTEYGIDPSQIATGVGREPFGEMSLAIVETFKPAVVSFHFGLPSIEMLNRVKSTGAFVLSSATTVLEAQWLEAHGADGVIAQGLEAGGHRGMFLSDDLTTQVSTFALLPQIVAAVKIPVIAAGGIVDANTVNAALSLGASMVQVGTAYMLCEEATTSAIHRRALVSSDAQHTAVTNLFTGRPARGIVNRVIRELGAINHLVPDFPLATNAIAPLRVEAEKNGLGDFSPLWSGQNTSGCRPIGAAELTHLLAQKISDLNLEN